LSRARRRNSLAAVLLAILAANSEARADQPVAGASASSPAPPDAERSADGASAPPALVTLRQRLVELLGEQRARLGLPPLTEVPAVRAAAQAHAEEMAAAGTLRFTSPAGTSLEERVAAAGHQAGLVAAKLYRAADDQDAERLAARWWESASASRNSVFHSRVSELGLGIAPRGGELYFTFLLTAPLTEVGVVQTESDLAPLREGFLAAANTAREARRLPPLRQQRVCEQAAQRHAEDLLSALRAGRDADAVTALQVLVQEDRRHAASEAVVGPILQRRGGSVASTAQARGVGVGSVVVVDAQSAAQAVRTALGDAGSALADPGYRTLGVGIALDPGGSRPHAVWVACLTRR
jgi:uncharacterized protein YkwD